MSGQIEASEEAQAEKKGGGRKKLLLLALPVLLVAIGAGLWFGGILPPLLGMGAPAATAEGREPGPRTVAFLDMPEIVTNLNAPGRRSVPDLLKGSKARRIARFSRDPAPAGRIGCPRQYRGGPIWPR